MLYFIPVGVLFNALVAHFGPWNREIILFGIELTHTRWEAVDVGRTIGCNTAANGNGHTFQRVCSSAKGSFGSAPTQLIPVCGLFESHFYASFAHDIVPCNGC